MLEQILQGRIDFPQLEITPFGSGLINNTWKVNRQDTDISYILQRVNHNVFKKPEDIANNVRLIGTYLAKHNPGYFFVRNIYTHKGNDLLFVEGQGYFRLVPFALKSHTVDVVQLPVRPLRQQNNSVDLLTSLTIFRLNN